MIPKGHKKHMEHKDGAFKLNHESAMRADQKPEKNGVLDADGFPWPIAVQKIQLPQI